MSTHYRHKNILIYKPSSLNHPKSIPVYPWTTDFLSLPMDWALLNNVLRLTKKYILSISQRPQSHKYRLKSAQANSRITHTDRRTKTESAYLIYFQSHIPTSSSLFLSLSLKRRTISHPESARRWENEKREEKKYNVPPSLRRGKSFRRGSLQTRRGNEIICADLRSCVFVINYGCWRGNTSESVGEDGSQRNVLS